MLKLTALTSPLAGGERHQLRGFVGGHRQRLLADDVLPGRQDCPDLRVMQLVGRGDVDHPDGVVREELRQARIDAREAELRGATLAELRGGLEQALDAHADAAQCLDVHATDETAADDGGADVTSSGHGYVTTFYSLIRRLATWTIRQQIATPPGDGRLPARPRRGRRQPTQCPGSEASLHDGRGEGARSEGLRSDLHGHIDWRDSTRTQGHGAPEARPRRHRARSARADVRCGHLVDPASSRNARTLRSGFARGATFVHVLATNRGSAAPTPALG